MRKIVSDLQAEAIVVPADPEVAARTESDWKCHHSWCRLPGDFFVTVLDDNDRVTGSYLVCFLHVEKEREDWKS